LVLGSYGLLYFTILGIWRLPEASAVIKRFLVTAQVARKSIAFPAVKDG
jgi:hypothetical protein